MPQQDNPVFLTDYFLQHIYKSVQRICWESFGCGKLLSHAKKSTEYVRRTIYQVKCFALGHKKKY
jgi:hypothetical protein